MLTFPLVFLFGSLFFCPYFHLFLISLQANHCLSKYFRFKNLQHTHKLQEKILTGKSFSKSLGTSQEPDGLSKLLLRDLGFVCYWRK